jgi:hypothetical protein
MRRFGVWWSAQDVMLKFSFWTFVVAGTLMGFLVAQWLYGVFVVW